jgi:hypothetical protein
MARSKQMLYCHYFSNLPYNMPLRKSPPKVAGIEIESDTSASGLYS